MNSQDCRTAVQVPNPGEFMVPFGKKYRGVKIKDIPRPELEAYIKWFEDEATRLSIPLNFEVRLLKKATELLYA